MPPLLALLQHWQLEDLAFVLELVLDLVLAHFALVVQEATARRSSIRSLRDQTQLVVVGTTARLWDVEIPILVVVFHHLLELDLFVVFAKELATFKMVVLAVALLFNDHTTTTTRLLSLVDHIS